jgi:hypothetical protein
MACDLLRYRLACADAVASEAATAYSIIPTGLGIVAPCLIRPEQMLRVTTPGSRPCEETSGQESHTTCTTFADGGHDK